MASLRRWWGSGGWGRLGQLRRSLQLLASIDQRLAEQNTYLARLADEFAPIPPAMPTADPVATTTAQTLPDIAFADPVEIQATEGWMLAFTTQYGRTPTDDELLTFLAERAERSFITAHAGGAR